MKLLLLMGLMAIAVNSFAQVSKVALSDTSTFMGMTTGEVMLQSKPNFSDPTLKLLPDLTFVAIISYEKSFWKVLRNSVIGYIDESDLDVSDDIKTYLKYQKWVGEEARIIGAQKLDESFMELEKVERAKTLKSYEKKGFVVTSWAFSSHDEYSDAFDVTFNVFNPTKKTVKYSWFTLTAYNAVGDVVGKSKTVNGVGPVKSYNGGSWEFEYVFFSKVIECIRISKIKVQYMDGTFKEYPNPNLVMGEGEKNNCK